jgi:hypothetical protein
MAKKAKENRRKNYVPERFRQKVEEEPEEEVEWEEEFPEEDRYSPTPPEVEEEEEFPKEEINEDHNKEERKQEVPRDLTRDPEFLSKVVSAIMAQQFREKGNHEQMTSQMKEGVQVVTTQEVPALQSLSPEAVKAYAAQVRRWLSKGNSTIFRNSWDDEINARIDIEWHGSREEERYGLSGPMKRVFRMKCSWISSRRGLQPQQMLVGLQSQAGRRTSSSGQAIQLRLLSRTNRFSQPNMPDRKRSGRK